MKHRYKQLFYGIVIGVLFAMIPAGTAVAHKVLLFAYVEGDIIHAEGYFADGKKVDNSLIEVFDSSGTKILDGKTDKEGQFVFKAPKKDDLRLVLNASMGHRAVFKITADKITINPSVGSDRDPSPDQRQKGRAVTLW